MVPLKGRGFDTVDIRIHQIDPLDRSFWPFPAAPVSVDDSAAPPAPGEEPKPFDDASRFISDTELAAQIKALGSPSISDLIALPLKKGGAAAKFGVDLKPYFARIGGAGKGGTRRVGVGRLDRSGDGARVRVQATGLSLAAIDGRWRGRS